MRRKIAAILAVVMTLSLVTPDIHAEASMKTGVTEGVQQGNTTATEGVAGTETKPTESTEKKETETTESVPGTETKPTESTEKTETETTESVPGTETKPTESTEKTETETTESTEKAEGTEKTEDTEKKETETESTESTEKKKDKLTEETETTEKKDKKGAEIESLPDDPEYLKYLEQQKTYGQMSNFFTAVHPRLGEGYTHDPKFSNHTIRHGIDVSYYQKNIDWNAVKASGVEFVFVRVGYRGYAPAGPKFSNHTIRHGIDVSYYQKNIDWNAVKASGVEFVFVRVGYRGYAPAGNMAVDPYAKQNLQGAINAGLKVGAYVFSQAVNEAEAIQEAQFALQQVNMAVDPYAKQNLQGAINAGLKVGAYVFSQAVNEAEAIQEAQFALQQVAGYNITMPIVMDFEYAYYSNGAEGRLAAAHLSRDQHTAIVNAFGATIRNAGYEPMIYANKSMLENSLNSWAIPYKIWLARYPKSAPFAAGYGGNYEFWQYTSGGYVNGIAGRVDCNFWYEPKIYTQTVKDGIYTIATALDEGMVLDIKDGSSANSANLQLLGKNAASQQDFKVTYVGDGKYTIMAMCSGKYLDAEWGGTTEGTNIVQYDGNSGDNQRWYIQDAGDGNYYIRSALSQMCMDVAGGAHNGANIHLWNYNGGLNQKFKYIQDAGDGNYYIRSALSQMCMDVAGGAHNGANIHLWNYNGGLNQKFKVKSVEYTQSVADGLYMISAEQDANLVWDVTDAAGHNSANIGIWETKNENNQKFYINHAGGNKYTISAKHSGKYVDAEWGGGHAGANIIQYDGNGADNQKWYFKDAGNGSYYIISAASGLYADIAGSVNMGNNIHLWDGNAGANQRFRLTLVSDRDTPPVVGEEFEGWHVENGKKYWYDHGTMARDKEVYDPQTDAWYWFDGDGSMATNKDVLVPTNDLRTEGKWVRYDVNGRMKKGEDYRYGGWYWFDPVTGEMIKDFVFIPEAGTEGKWVYYDEVDGKMHHGESCIDGNWYYFDEWTGKMVHGEYYRNGNWYYYDQITGIMAHGWVTLPNGTRAYYDEITGIRR